MSVVVKDAEGAEGLAAEVRRGICPQGYTFFGTPFA